MAKRKKTKIKKHVFKLDEIPQAYDFVLFGIQTQQPLYQFVYDFNRLFGFGFKAGKDIKVIRKNREVSFENYVTEDNAIGQKKRLLNNEILVPIAHPNTLFDTHEAYYLFPELPSIHYLLMIQNDDDFNFGYLQQNFKVPYKVTWIEIDLKKCATVFPVFPV